MANEIKIKITSASDAKGFKEVNKELKETSTVAELAERDVDKLDDTLVDVGKSASNTRDQIAKLDRSITTSTQSLRLMASALADTDDAAQRIDIKKAMAKVQADLNTSIKAKKILDIDDLIDTEPSPVFKGKLISGIGSAVSGAGDVISGGVAKKAGLVIGAAIGSVVVASAGSVITAGVGAGLLGAGIGLAMGKDKQLQEAGARAGKNFMDGMQDEAVKAFKGPAMEAVQRLGDLGELVTKKMGKAFRELAPSVGPLVDDIVVSVDRITDALVNVAGDSGPALQGLGNSIVLISDGIGDMLETVATGSPEAADNLTLIAGVLADVLRIGGEVFNVVSKIGEFVIPGFEGLRDHYKSVAEESSNLSDEQRTLTDEMTFAADAANGERSALEELAGTLKAQTDPVFGMIDAQEKLKEAQDNYSKAVKKSGKGSEEADEALRDMAKAAIDLEGKVGALGETFNGEVSPAMRATMRAAGMTDDEINELAKQFRATKRDADKFAKTYEAKAKVAGIPAAQSGVQGLKGELDGIRNTWVGNVIIKVKEFFTGGKASGGIQGAASGHVSDGLTWVGEQGPELVKLPAGSRVHSSGDSQRMMQQSMSGGGMPGELIVRAAPSAHQDLMGVLVESLQFYVRTHAGGSVQQAFGRPGVRS